MMGTLLCHGIGVSVRESTAGSYARRAGRHPGRTIATLLASGLVGLLVPTSGHAATPPAIVCYREARQQLSDCENQAKDQCTASFQSTFGTCFGANAGCATDCQTRDTNCEAGPRGRQDACSAACSETAKKGGIMCRSHKDQDSCNIGVKLKSLKCKQRCAQKSSEPLQRCSQDFNACLIQCAGG